MQQPVVEPRHRGELRAAQPRRAGDDGLENRLEVGRRARDCAQDLARRGVLLARLDEFGSARVELPPKLGVGPFELGHPVVDRRRHPIIASR